jgi:hypothetical protein
MNTHATDDDLVNLAEIIPPVRDLLAFWDQVITDQDPPIEQLDDAVRRLKALPAIGGQIGQDLALMANGGRGAKRDQIVASLQRLRALASMDTHHPPNPNNPVPPTAA